MTRWAPFLWLTAIVLVVLLALARVSSGVVRDGDGPTASRRPEPGHLGEPRSPDAGPGATDADPSSRTTGQTGVWTPSPPAERTESPGKRAGSSGEATGTPDAPPNPRAEPPPGDERRGDLQRPAHQTGQDQVELSWGMLLANVAVTQGLVGLVLAAGVLWFDVPLSALGLSGAPWVGGVPALGLGLAFGVVLWVGNEAAASLADAVGATYDEAVRGMLAPQSVRGWVVLLGFVLPTVAVVEELLFRAALIGVPAAATGVSPWLLAIASSIAFALGHGAQGRVGVAVTGALGLVLAGGYVLTGSLLVVIVAHYVVNATEFVVHEGLGFDRLW